MSDEHETQHSNYDHRTITLGILLNQQPMKNHTHCKDMQEISGHSKRVAHVVVKEDGMCDGIDYRSHDVSALSDIRSKNIKIFEVHVISTRFGVAYAAST